MLSLGRFTILGSESALPLLSSQYNYCNRASQPTLAEGSTSVEHVMEFNSAGLIKHLCVVAKSFELIEANLLVADSMNLPTRFLLHYVAAAFGS